MQWVCYVFRRPIKVSTTWRIWKLRVDIVEPSRWSVVMAAKGYLSSTTVNLAEYTGMKRGAQAALYRQVYDLIKVGYSRIAIH